MAFKFRIDVSRCIGCRACEVACVTVNDLNPSHARCFVPYLEANETKTAHATYAPYLCHHCEEPPCVPACPTGASYKAADGRVLVDKELCIGCGMCVKACPYDARYVDPGSKKLEKCTLCDGRVQAGLAPACFDVCPADARLFEEVVEIDGRSQTVRIGNVSKPDAGHKQMKLVSETVNPKPRLILSGRPEDLELVAAKRPPKLGFVMPAAIWRNGAGWLVQGLGVASMAAMAGMVALRVLRGRKNKINQAEKDNKPPPADPPSAAN